MSDMNFDQIKGKMLENYLSNWENNKALQNLSEIRKRPKEPIGEFYVKFVELANVAFFNTDQSFRNRFEPHMFCKALGEDPQLATQVLRRNPSTLREAY